MNDQYGDGISLVLPLREIRTPLKWCVPNSER